ncbi:MAG: alternative oxidase [Chromatiales bacterium]|nr:alternative oxidase [Chromatiales bacterium]
MVLEDDIRLDHRHQPSGISDRIARALVSFMRFFADAFFAGRYGHRAVVLETVAAVPGMVGGAIQHLRSLRRLKDDDDWIRTLLDEAENERMHLMTFLHIAQPNRLERAIIVIAQMFFYYGFFLLYMLSTRTAHRMVGYLEEEAVYSYTQYREAIDSGRHENVRAPALAIRYWKLSPDARLREVVEAVRADEAKHRDVNHGFADQIDSGDRR